MGAKGIHYSKCTEVFTLFKYPNRKKLTPNAFNKLLRFDNKHFWKVTERSWRSKKKREPQKNLVFSETGRRFKFWVYCTCPFLVMTKWKSEKQKKCCQNERYAKFFFFQEFFFFFSNDDDRPKWLTHSFRNRMSWKKKRFIELVRANIFPVLGKFCINPKIHHDGWTVEYPKKVVRI